MGKKNSLRFTILITLLLLCIGLSLSVGAVKLPLSSTVQILANNFLGLTNDPIGINETILLQLRLPRIILAIIIGAMLSTAGVAFQGVLRNPLADPYILGISTGAALGAAISILLGRLQISWLSNPWSVPLFAFVGSIISLWLVISLAHQGGYRGRESLILAGVIIQSLLGAFLSFLIASSGEQMQQIVYWMMGSLANKNWTHVYILTPYFILGMVLLLLKYRELDIFALGEQAAAHLGLNVERTKVFILASGSLLTAAAVSVVGVIGFVGLIVPHMMRILVGPNHRTLLIASSLAGGVFLLLSDTIARTIIPSREIPIGVITAFVGAPFFAYLFKRSLRRG